MKFSAYLLVLLAGCASTPYWERTGDPAQKIVVHSVGGAPWPGVVGWAQNEAGICHIYISRTAPNRACVEAHERMHCAGFDHARGAMGQC
jgi:hypothetical protein